MTLRNIVVVSSLCGDKVGELNLGITEACRYNNITTIPRSVVPLWRQFWQQRGGAPLLKEKVPSKRKENQFFP
jgi:hypothetical protein